MGEGAARRGSGRRYPRPGPGTRKVHPPRWTLGTDPSSEVGGPLAREYRTGQNIWKKRLRISGTHILYSLCRGLWTKENTKRIAAAMAITLNGLENFSTDHSRWAINPAIPSQTAMPNQKF